MGSEGRIVTGSNTAEIAAWCGGRQVVQHDALDHDKITYGINVPVGDEVERASEGDMVIRNHDGSFRIHKQEW
jgi:hypothetical protein